MYRPVLDVALGANQQLVGGVWEARILQPEYGFDMCVLALNRAQLLVADYPPGTPVRVVYGRNRASTAVFVGYVAYSNIRATMNTAQVKLVCVGAAGIPLKDAAHRLWAPGSSASQAVTAIATATQLSALVETTGIEAVGGPVNESWWSYIRRCAKTSGFTCYTAGTDLRFHSRRIDGSGRSVPWFQYHNTPAVRYEHTLYEATVTDEDEVGDGGLHRKRRAYGVTDEGLLLGLTDNGDLQSAGGIRQELPGLTRTENMVVHDMGEATLRLTAAQETNRFTRTSSFFVSGDESVHQTSTVVLRGIRADLDGYWYVMSATHILGSQSYGLQLVAGRDGVGDNAPLDLTAVAPVVDAGLTQPQPTPAPVLRSPQQTMTDLVFPSRKQAWVASLVASRSYLPWRAAVRG